MKKSKIFTTVGMVLCGVFFLLGFLALVGAFTGSISHSDHTTRSSGYSTFGADFYTYVNNNAAMAAANTGSAANNLAHLQTLVATVGGIIIMAISGIGFCLFGYLNEKIAAADAAPKSMSPVQQFIADQTRSAPTVPVSSAYSAQGQAPAAASDAVNPLAQTPATNAQAPSSAGSWEEQARDRDVSLPEGAVRVKLDFGNVVCPICSTRQPGNRTVCSNCGTQFIVEQ